MPTDTSDLATTYTTPEENNVYSYDGVRVDLAGATGKYLLHQFKKTNENRTDDISVRIVGRSSYAPTSSIVYLQVWNGTTLSWDTIDSENLAGANADFDLTAKVLSNDANYYDFGNQVAFRIYQNNNSGVSKTLSVDQVRISFIPIYSDSYSPTGNTYSPQYEGLGSKYASNYSNPSATYSKKYPSKNPQDDL